MSHDRCVRSCYFALFLPSVFLSLCPALAGIPLPSVLLSAVFRRFLSVLLPAVFRWVFSSSLSSCPVPCGIPLARPLPLPFVLLSAVFRRSVQFCSLRYSAGAFPPRFLRVLLSAVFRRLVPFRCLLSCFQRYSGVLFSSAPCGIPLGLFLLAFSLSCSLRYSTGSSPSAAFCPAFGGIPAFCSVLLPAVFRRQSPFSFNPPQAHPSTPC